MSNPLQRCTITFIVRVWGEYLNCQPPSWRGVLELCDRGEEIVFSNLEDLLAIIQENTKDHLIMEYKNENDIE